MALQVLLLVPGLCLCWERGAICQDEFLCLGLRMEWKWEDKQCKPGWGRAWLMLSLSLVEWTKFDWVILGHSGQ